MFEISGESITMSGRWTKDRKSWNFVYMIVTMLYDTTIASCLDYDCQDFGNLKKK